ncbi:cyclic nucleotide-binding domain-containing protein, partial [Cutibacterium acnes]
MQETEYADGAVILQQGQPGDRLHIVLSGTLDVVVEQETKVSVAKLAPGSIVGEMSCLTGGVISASVKAVGRVRTVSLPRNGLLELMDRSSAFRK